MSRDSREYSDTCDALTDMVTFLESIDVALDRIANVMEMNHERALEREAAEQEEREKADRELAEAETRYPGITADGYTGHAFVPPF
jgi:hypothetical protein